MTVLYVAGPMTGMPDLNYPLFFLAEDLLKVAGYTVLNPARNKPEKQDWLSYMRMSLHQIAECDGICTLHGWGESRGAALEVHIVTTLGLRVEPTNYWLEANHG